MKIALIRQKYSPHGGAERFLSNMLKQLNSDNQLSIHLIARKWQQTDNIQLHSCKPFYIGRTWRNFSFSRQACRIIKQLDVDLVQSHERIACCDIYRAGDGVHRIWLQHKNHLKPWPIKYLDYLNLYHLYNLFAEKQLFTSPQLRVVICNSNMVKNEISHYFPAIKDKLHVIYNGVDIDYFHPKHKLERDSIRNKLSIPTHAPVFLFVGSGFERKGLLAAITSLAALSDNDARLVVIGHDKRINKYKKVASQLQLTDRVIFLGAMQELAPYYAMADAFIFPTLYDPFPNVVLEALACGIPVITSTHSGAAEVIQSGEQGYVCDTYDTQQLTQAMIKLTDPALAAEMGNKARQLAEKFNLAHQTAQIADLYKKILSL
ncbi:MAG: glycosyltransferase [Methyloprofundus sp.]|nr:glycosyltransferase [Methyloprofundus sp.]